MLNAEGYTTKEGKLFHSMQVKRILDRKTLYQGTYKYSGVEFERATPGDSLALRNLLHNELYSVCKVRSYITIHWH